MKNSTLIIGWTATIIALFALGTFAAPAPYPLPINSQAQTAPPVLVYRASETAFRVRFTDGSTASDISGCIPFMAWSTNANATGVSTSSYSIVSATNGMVDFHFDPSAVNYAAGRYLYEVGVRSNAVPRVYRQGIFQIYNSPVGAGVSAVTWSTPVNWSLLDWSNLPTITVNGVTGSIETNLSFTVTGSGGGSVSSVNGQTGTVVITASGLGALTNEADPIALAALSTNRVTKLFDTTETRYIDGTGGVWQVSTITNSAMANWHVTVISDIKNGGGATVATNLTDEVFDDPIGVPPLSLGQYAIQNVVRGGYRWSIYRASDAKQLTVFVQNIGDVTSQYLSQNMDPPTYTNAICTAWPGGASAGQCRVTYTPIVVTISVVTSALPRVAFISDTASLLSTNGNGSALTDMTVSQIAGAYPSANPSNFVTQSQVANLASTNYVNALVASNTTVPRAWMPLTTHSQFGYVDLACASNSVINIGPAPLNSFVIRPLIMSAANASVWTYSNIVFYCDRAITDPRAPQGFNSATTGVFTISNWGMPTPKGFVMRRNDSLFEPGLSRKNIAAYSLGIAGTSIRLMCLWSPATDAELADADGIIDYGNDAR